MLVTNVSHSKIEFQLQEDFNSKYFENCDNIDNKVRYQTNWATRYQTKYHSKESCHVNETVSPGIIDSPHSSYYYY